MVRTSGAAERYRTTVSNGRLELTADTVKVEPLCTSIATLLEIEPLAVRVSVPPRMIVLPL